MTKSKKPIILAVVLVIAAVMILAVLFLPEENGPNQKVIVVETPYGVLEYPREWRKNIRTEVIDEEGCTVKFYGTIKEKGELELFDVLLNGIGIDKIVLKDHSKHSREFISRVGAYILSINSNYA